MNLANAPAEVEKRAAACGVDRGVASTRNQTRKLSFVRAFFTRDGATRETRRAIKGRGQ